jgi:hypothetical protein
VIRSILEALPPDLRDLTLLGQNWLFCLLRRLRPHAGGLRPIPAPGSMLGLRPRRALSPAQVIGV